ncbi:MAG TPA: ATP synthase F1 subunit gamma [Blastocatellia bacterium]|nr:ATP synthase F1 subunit gamma [Blastocatellia bacterium]
MANLQDIRRRIRSVKSMQQLTRAMKMVSAAKLKRAQDRVISARPYASTMSRVFGRLAERASDYSHPLLDQRKDDNYLVVLITADKGLCGAFNTNLIKAAQQFVRDNPNKKTELVTIGRKGRDFFRRRNFAIAKEYINVTARAFEHSDAAAIAADIIELFSAEGSSLDKVFLISNDFRSVLSQKVIIKQLLPISGEALSAPGKQDSHSGGAKVLIDYIYEQPPAEIFGKLLPKYVETQIFHALLESVASEQGARMTAMDAASKNAGDVISNLTLNMNRVRQASITREIIEVVSGAQALK